MPSREDVSAFLPALFREQTPIPFAFNLYSKQKSKRCLYSNVMLLCIHFGKYLDFWHLIAVNIITLCSLSVG